MLTFNKGKKPFQKYHPFPLHVVNARQNLTGHHRQGRDLCPASNQKAGYLFIAATYLIVVSLTRLQRRLDQSSPVQNLGASGKSNPQGRAEV